MYLLTNMHLDLDKCVELPDRDSLIVLCGCNYNGFCSRPRRFTHKTKYLSKTFI